MSAPGAAPVQAPLSGLPTAMTGSRGGSRGPRGADRRDPPQLRPNGINGGGRVDRFYVTSGLWDAGAVLSAAQQDSGGASDHEFSLLTIGLAELARADAPGTRQ